MTNKTQIVIILAIIFLGIVWFGFQSGQEGQSEDIVREQTSGKDGKASVSLDFGDGRIRTFEGKVMEEMTLWDSLFVSAKAGGFSVSFIGNQKPSSIVINGAKASSNKKWQAYLDGEKVEDDPMEILIEAGDNIIWRYETVSP